MAVEPQLVRIVLEDPAGGRQPAPGQRPSWMPPPNPVPPGTTNRLPPPNPNVGPQPGPGPGPQSGPTPPPPNPQPPPPNPVLADMAARADKVAESNKALAAAMADPTYLSATLRLAAAQEQQAELVQQQRDLADKAREVLKYGPGGKPAGTDTTAGVTAQAEAVAKASAELAGAIADPAYRASLDRLAEAQEKHAEATKEAAKLAEAARDKAKYGPGGKPAGTDTLTGMGDQADKQEKANKELAAALSDPAYLAGQKRLLAVEEERVRLAKEAEKVADQAKYGARGAAGKAAADGVAERGGGAVAQLAAGAWSGGKAGASAAAEGLGGMPSAAGQVADELAGVAQRIANNDVGSLLAGTANTVADGLMQIPGPAGAVGAGLKVVTAAATAYAEVTEALVQRGRELMGYNADLAAANAMANVKRMEADMKEAESIGKDTGRLTENQADISANLRELILPIKELLVEVMADISEGVKTATEIAKPLGVVLKWMLKVVFALPIGAIKAFAKVMEWLNKKFAGGEDDEPKEGDLNSLMRSLFDSFDRIQPGQGMAGAGRGAPAPAPMFGRGL